MLSRLQRIRRGFRRLGLFLAAILLTIGLVLMAFDVADLNVWHLRREDFPTASIDIGLGALSLVFACLALWATVRGLGWVVSKFVIDEHPITDSI